MIPDKTEYEELPFSALPKKGSSVILTEVDPTRAVKRAIATGQLTEDVTAKNGVVFGNLHTKRRVDNPVPNIRKVYQDTNELAKFVLQSAAGTYYDEPRGKPTGYLRS